MLPDSALGGARTLTCARIRGKRVRPDGSVLGRRILQDPDWYALCMARERAGEEVPR